MNIIYRLTLRHLNQNLKRTIVTILGIAMSTSLISAILLGAFSFFNFFSFLAVRSDGNVQVAFYEISKEQADIIKEDVRTKYLGIRDADPYISGVRLQNDKEERFKVGNITYGNIDYFDEMIICEYEGRFPENSSEIAVEEKFLKENNLNINVGDKLTFEQGYRYFIDTDGKEVYLAGNYRSDEVFSSKELKTCTVTAILHGNRPTGNFDILCGMDREYFPTSKNVEARLCLKKSNHTSIVQIKEIANKAGANKYDLNSEYLLSVFAFEGSAGSYRALFVIMAIALLIVIVTSIILIVNSIGMSLTERIRYLGMLASVGATGRQKRFSIYFEGLILGMIGIPLGILIGYIGTKMTLIFLGSKILETEMLAGSEGLRGSIPVKCSPWVIVAIVLASAVTIFISVLVPAFKAARIMPIDAIRQSNTIKVKSRSLRVNPIVRLLFGYEGELAYKNIKRNGIKGTVITLSIAVSAVLFLTISYFCDSIKKANRFDFELPYQIIASCSYKEAEKMREDISSMDEVEEVFCAGIIQFYYKQDSQNSLTLANKDIVNPDFLTKDYADLDLSSINLVLVEDEDFDRILDKNGIEPAKYHGDTLRGILLNSIFHEKNATKVFNDGILGQRLCYDETEGFPPAVEIADLVKYDNSEYIFKLIPQGSISVFVPESEYYKAAEKTIGADVLTYDLGVVTNDHKKTEEDIYDMFETNGYHDYNCSDLEMQIVAVETVTLMINTAMYGFTGLLTLITIANIINTISTGLLLRRKEFAMYKSVGMDNTGFKKMMWLETFLYGLRALIVAIPVSILFDYLMYSSLSKELYSFVLNPITLIVCILAVFLIVGSGMILSINKIKADSIIETLKEDAV